MRMSRPWVRRWEKAFQGEGTVSKKALWQNLVFVGGPARKLVSLEWRYRQITETQLHRGYSRTPFCWHWPRQSLWMRQGKAGQATSQVYNLGERSNFSFPFCSMGASTACLRSSR